MKIRSKISFNAPVTLSFAFACVAVYLLGMVTGGKSDVLFCAYRGSLLSPLTYVRCVLSCLGHMSTEHLVNNMMFVLVLGPNLEEKYGGGSLLLVFLVAAFASGFSSILLFPDIALMGASGIVFAMILLSSFSSGAEGKIPLTFLLVAVLYIGGEIVDGLLVNDNVSQFAHIIGGAVGSAFGFLFAKHR